MPEGPELLEYLWSAFLDLMDPSGAGMGPSLIGYQEIDAYGRIFGKPFRDWEIYTIRALSVKYVEIANEKGKNIPKGAKNLTKMDDNEGLKSLFMKQGQKPKG